MDKAEVLRRLPLREGMNVFDAGCGNGYMSKEFARIVGPRGRVVAMDPLVSSINTLLLESAGTPIEAVVGDVTKETGIAPASVDLVYLSNVFHGFTRAEREGFFREVERVLKPGGILAVVEMDKRPFDFGPPPEKKFSPEELRAVVPLTPGETALIGEFLYLQLFSK